jgi:FeS assembly SUF system regulator
MLRIRKLTDYGIVLLAHLAGEDPGATRNAREIAESTGLPLPVVSKMLKLLAGAELLQSQRGAKGGYSLARDPGQLTVAEIIAALEGPIALMDCTVGTGHCEQEAGCPVRDPWQRINQAVHHTLERVTLQELVRPTAPGLLTLSERGGRRPVPSASPS